MLRAAAITAMLGALILPQTLIAQRTLAEMNEALAGLELKAMAEVRSPGLHHVKIELTKQEQEIAAQGARAAPEFAILTIGLPEGFEPDSQQRMLITSVTSDLYAPNAYSARNYARAASDAGWVVVSADANVWPERDTIAWRLVMLGAALRTLHSAWPESTNWPVAAAGFSGGSKLSFYTLAFARKVGHPPAGLFLGGCNESSLREALEMLQLPADALEGTPVLVSVGAEDRVSTVAQSKRVARRVADAGLGPVELRAWDGGHSLHPPHVREALSLFDQELIAEATAASSR